MRIAEGILLFLAGAGVFCIAAYLLGWKKKTVGLYAVSVALGAAACIAESIFGEITQPALFVSGLTGLIGNLLLMIPIWLK